MDISDFYFYLFHFAFFLSLYICGDFWNMDTCLFKDLNVLCYCAFFFKITVTLKESCLVWLFFFLRRGRKPGPGRKNGGTGAKGKDKKLSGTDSEQEVGGDFTVWIDNQMRWCIFAENRQTLGGWRHKRLNLRIKKREIHGCCWERVYGEAFTAWR